MKWCQCLSLVISSAVQFQLLSQKQEWSGGERNEGEEKREEKEESGREGREGTEEKEGREGRREEKGKEVNRKMREISMHVYMHIYKAVSNIGR